MGTIALSVPSYGASVARLEVFETRVEALLSREPCAWLESTREKVAGRHPQSRIRDLLPWNFDPASN